LRAMSVRFRGPRALARALPPCDWGDTAFI
jgi:hypothetical protein